MLGTKIRSWMETHIVRSRKKQHRNKQDIKICTNGTTTANNTKDTISGLNGTKEASTKKTANEEQKSLKTILSTAQMRHDFERDEANTNTNLSSPESAYSTGYSTDGTSPGVTFPVTVPSAPEYYINIRTGTRYFHSSLTDIPVKLLPTSQRVQQQPPKETKINYNTKSDCVKSPPPAAAAAIQQSVVSSPVSLRQRNRIRTNPWVTAVNQVGCNCSPIHSSNNSNKYMASQQTITLKTTQPMLHQSIAQPRRLSASPLAVTSAAHTSPMQRKWSYTKKRHNCAKYGVNNNTTNNNNAYLKYEAYSSSSSSSVLSVNSVHHTTIRPSVSITDDEDDHTLNEMMGKYDESYVYEKETDILSDSDPTDCDEAYDDENDNDGDNDDDDDDDEDDDDDDENNINTNGCDFEFIDSIGSLELNSGMIDNDRSLNMGHCTYHNFHDDKILKNQTGPKSCFSPLSKYCRNSERRSRYHVSSSKKRRNNQHNIAEHILLSRTKAFQHLNGSQSAGTTPVSMRKRCITTTPKSEHTSPNTSRYSVISRRRNDLPVNSKLYDIDRESDQKYRQLIIEAEHLIMAMRTNSPSMWESPVRRIPNGPSNKRIELLKNENCAGGIIGANSSTNSNSPKHRTKLIPILHQHCPQSEPVKRKIYANHLLPTFNGNANMMNIDSVSNSSNHSVFQKQKHFHGNKIALRSHCENKYGTSQRLPYVVTAVNTDNI